MFKINDPTWRNILTRVYPQNKNEFIEAFKTENLGFKEKDGRYVISFGITQGFTEDNIELITDDEDRTLTLITKGVVNGVSISTTNKCSIPDDGNINTLEALFGNNKLYVMVDKI